MRDLDEAVSAVNNQAGFKISISMDRIWRLSYMDEPPFSKLGLDILRVV